MPQTLSAGELAALASKLQIGPDRRIEAKLEVDHLIPAVPAVAPAIVQTSNAFTSAGPNVYQHFGMASTPGATRVLVWAGLWRQLTSSPQPPGDGETWEAIETGHFYDDHDSPDPCAMTAYKARCSIAQANHLLQGSTGGGGAGVLIGAVMWELSGADYDSITGIHLDDQAASLHIDIGDLGVLPVGKLALLAVGNGDDGGHVMTVDPRQWTVDLMRDRDETAGAANSFYGDGFPLGWWGHRFGDGATDVEARVDTDQAHTFGGLAIVVSPDEAHAGSEAHYESRSLQVTSLVLDRSRKMAAAQLDASLANEDGSLGYYTGSGILAPNNQCRAYVRHGSTNDWIRKFTGLLDRDSDHHDPKTVAIKARSRMKLLLAPHVFVKIASQTAGDTGAIRTEDNGVYLGKSPEYIANDILDRAGWDPDARNIAVSGITIPEYDLADMGAWADQISGTDRLTAIAGWDMVEDELGVLNLGPNALAAEDEPDEDWTFEAGVNVMAYDHQVDDEERATRVRVSGPMTSTIPVWKEEWSTTKIRHPVGLAFVPASPTYLYAIDWKSQYLSRIRLSDRKVVQVWPLGAGITYFPGGLCYDTVTGDFFVLDTDWVHGGTNHAEVQRFDGATKAHVATYALPDGQWAAIKTDGANLWLTNYGDDKLYKRSMTAVAVSSGTITYSGDLQHNPTGLWIDGTTIGVFFEGIERFLLVDSAAPGVVTGVQSTKGTQITGGEKNTVTHDELWADADGATAGHIWAFDLADEVTTDVVKWAIDYDLEDAMGLQAGVADRIHPDCPNSDDPHPYEIRVATVELRTVNSPEQAQTVADYQILLLKRLRRTLDLKTIGHPGVQVRDWNRYVDAVAGTDAKWMVDTLRDELAGAGTYITQMSVLPWEAA